MSDKLSEVLWVEPKAKPASPETRVEDALQRALDTTTPERPGVPWDEDKKEDLTEGGYVVPGDDS